MHQTIRMKAQHLSILSRSSTARLSYMATANAAISSGTLARARRGESSSTGKT